MKQSVYIESSVVSYLASRRSRDLLVAAHQQVTIQWWEQRAHHFALFVSELVEAEVAQGDSEASIQRRGVVEGIPILPFSDDAAALADRLIRDGAVPNTAAADALHIAIAAVNAVDFLLTWNCKHLANAQLRKKIATLVSSMGYTCPIICTPEELLEG